jgi:hypothetical protein
MGAVLARGKLAAVLSRLESPFDGERAAAGLLASRMVRAAGLSWEDVVTPALAPERVRPPDPPPAGWRTMVARCRLRRDLLTDWELRFLATLATQARMSVRQSEILEGIAAKIRAASND